MPFRVFIKGEAIILKEDKLGLSGDEVVGKLLYDTRHRDVEMD